MKKLALILFTGFAFISCDSNTSSTKTTSIENTQSTASSETISAASNSGTAGIADSIYHNAKIYTVDAANSWAEAVATKDGKIVAVGNNNDVMQMRGDNTAVTDLAGRMLMPGIHDTHVHPADAGQKATLQCSFLSPTLDEALAVIKGCVEKAQPGEWIRGGQWNEGYFINASKEPKELLNDIAPDNPVFLMDWSVHHAWVNSAALDALGINKDTPDPKGGIINRNEATGEAIGLLYDNAAYRQYHVMPPYSLEQDAGALAWAIDELKSYGVTTIKDAIVTGTNMAAYQELYRTGKLPIRVKTNLSWKSAWAKSHDDEKKLIANRDQYQQDMIDTNFIKIMLDGVPMSYTSVLLEPYEPNDVVGDNHTSELMIPEDQLIKDVVALDKQGLSIKIHATGDGSARAALNAFEAARKANGPNGALHEVSHAEMIHPDDQKRFKELNVAAEMCPIIWYPIPGLTWEKWFGDRIPQWQVKTLSEAGALVSYGSDWPVVPTPNPWPGIEAMVTRSDPYQAELKPEFVSEAVDLATAVRVFTHNSAIANLVGDSSGSIEVGKDADFIVLDQNLFDIDIMAVGDTKVLLSVVGGTQILNELANASATGIGAAKLPVSASPEDAVRKTVETYVEGTKSGNLELLKTAFHPKARMVGYMGPELLSDGPEPFYGALTENPPDDAMRANYGYIIRDIEVNGNIAIATLHERGLFDQNFTNYFMLLNENGEWSITHKSFVAIDEEGSIYEGEEPGVRAAIQKYIDGTLNSDVEKIQSAFHPKASMVGYMRPDLLTDGPEPYYEFIRQNPATAETRASYTTKVRDVNINGSIARATLTEDDFFGMDFVTHLALVKTGDSWAISNKSFHVK